MQSVLSGWSTCAAGIITRTGCHTLCYIKYSSILLPELVQWCAYTGHGGPNAADFVRNNLFDSLLSNAKFPKDIKAALGELQALTSMSQRMRPLPGIDHLA